MPCADCLLVISSRHGNLAAVSPVLHMFYSQSLNLLISASGYDKPPHWCFFFTNGFDVGWLQSGFFS